MDHHYLSNENISERRGSSKPLLCASLESEVDKVDVIQIQLDYSDLQQFSNALQCFTWVLMGLITIYFIGMHPKKSARTYHLSCLFDGHEVWAESKNWVCLNFTSNTSTVKSLSSFARMIIAFLGIPHFETKHIIRLLLISCSQNVSPLYPSYRYYLDIVGQ